MALQVAYLVNQYPAVSQTFIRREIQALERKGIVVQRIALRGWDAVVVDDSDRKELALTRYVLKAGALGLAVAVLRSALTRPLRWLAAAGLALRMAKDSHRPLPIHLVYFAEACLVRGWLANSGAQHLHAHFATNPAEIAMLVRELGGPPYSFTAHGSDIMDRPSQIGLHETVARARFVAAVCWFGRGQILRWIPPSLWPKVSVVGCGLEPGYGVGASAPLAEPNKRLLCIGRLSKEKGQSLLIEAVAQLHVEGIHVEITLVGDGPMRAEIQDLVVRRGLEAAVHFAGSLDAQGVETELRRTRALVVPSLSEGLPVVIMEAMANRRAVIAPFLSGIPELVIHGETGWLYPVGNVEALVRAIRTCLDTAPDTLAAMGEQARQRVWASHDADREAATLLALMSLSMSPATAD